MQGDPQTARYRPETPILSIASWIADPVEAARFPAHTLRFRNDRAAREVGLADMSDADWIAHFGRFGSLADNLPAPLALRYHGHQFRNYNPDIGDGRGFLFAQMRDGGGRLMDLGTKGSGQTPHSRFGDGKLTCKGAVREILATEMLEALGVHTSRTFSVIETGESLERGDEPSPTRSAVMVRLSHGHIRIGSFQRLAFLREEDHLRALTHYALTHYPGPPPPEDAPGRDDPAVRLVHLVVERLADQAASYAVAGFVHGVLNTDNMNVSGESFDYGPWRFLPQWDAAFTAAYFDREGLYAFGRQGDALHWNCAQLAIALRPICEAEPLIAALDRYAALFTAAVRRRFAWRLGVRNCDDDTAAALVSEGEKAMRATGMQPDAFFHAARTDRLPPDAADFAAVVSGTDRVADTHPYWSEETAQSMLIEEVEAIWAAIDRDDDWTPLHAKVEAVRRMGDAHGDAPRPAGQPQ
ncbi:protein adenylyltransferase SelO family protein [Croceicoccus sp. YJ47]|uniref:protein adenylyltransferase SelO family protein n=1 Tax=Croceicoccus sp. YJ47 TaxID=2798724 RepID=UPI001920BFAD|nr:YdiU family protein [Croceicoccus sp. YJ47]QQN74526.1 YdiU family protein [Croceicoccus sp. YJ47]